MPYIFYAMHFFFLTVLLLLSPLTIWADDSAFGGDAANVYPIENTEIQMVKEKVRVFPTTDGLWKTEATFWFKNLSNKTVDVQMGFPDWQISDVDDNGNEKPHWAILAFISKVDDKPIATEHKLLGKDPSKMDYQGAYLWRVSFKPHEEKKLQSSYIFGGFQQSAMFGEALRKSAGAVKGGDWWQASPETKVAKEMEQSPFQKILYILKTGKNWAGQIEEAEITVALPSNQNPLTVSPIPPGYTYENNKITWHFKNFKPTQDAVVFIAAPFDKKTPIVVATPQQEASWKKLVAQNSYDKFSLDVVRNGIFAAGGRIFQREDLRKFFNAQSWYSPSGDAGCPKTPRFENYPATEIYKGPAKEIDFNSAPKNSPLNPTTFKTVLREGLAKGANFSGHYTVVSWGCGTSCQTNAILDAKTGKIITIDLPTTLGIDFKWNSSLLITDPIDPNLPNRVVGDKTIPVAFYKFENNQLLPLCQQ